MTQRAFLSVRVLVATCQVLLNGALRGPAALFQGPRAPTKPFSTRDSLPRATDAFHLWVFVAHEHVQG